MKKTGMSLAAIAVAALTVAGCSSGGSGNSSAGASDPAGGSSSGSAPIKIGVICSCSGTYATVAQNQVKVFELSIDTINAAGGVNGHKFQVKEVNDEANPGTSITVFKQLVSAKVASITSFSDVDSSWGATAAETGIPIVGSLLAVPSFYTYPDYYPEGQTADSATSAVVNAAKTAGAENLGIIYCKESAACTALEAGAKAAATAAGLDVSYTAQVASTAPNYTAQCLAAKQSKTASILLLMDSNTAETIAANCNSQQYDPIYLQTGSGVNFSIVTKAPGLKNHFLAPFDDLPSISKNPAVVAMNAAIEKKYPGLAQTEEWTESNPSAWYTAIQLATALKAGGLTATGTPTAAMVIKGLESFKGETLGGLTPPLTYNPGKPNSIKCFFTAAVTNGVATILNDSKPTCSG